jgi:hypothetical protein
MTDAAIQALIDAAKIGDGDVVTWAEMQAILEGFKSQVSLTDISASLNQIPKWNGSAWVAADDETADAGTGLNSDQTLTADRTYTLGLHTQTWDGGDTSGSDPMWVWNDDLPGTGTATRTWLKINGLRKNGYTKNWYMNQSSQRSGAGTIYNEVMTMGWNLSAGGGLADAGVGEAIGLSFESNYDPDGDDSNPWVEYHTFYVTSTGTQVRLDSFTINPDVEDIDYYMSVDRFYLKNGNRMINGLSSDDYFAVAHQAGGDCRIYMRGVSYGVYFDFDGLITQVRKSDVVANSIFKLSDFARLRITAPTYADEAAASAASLVTGDIYKTSGGELRIKL